MLKEEEDDDEEGDGRRVDSVFHTSNCVTDVAIFLSRALDDGV